MSNRNIKTREGYDYWDRVCSIPRYGFVLSPSGNYIQKMEGVGSWVDVYEVQKIVDSAQDEINFLRSEVKHLQLKLEGI